MKSFLVLIIAALAVVIYMQHTEPPKTVYVTNTVERVNTVTQLVDRLTVVTQYVTAISHTLVGAAIAPTVSTTNADNKKPIPCAACNGVGAISKTNSIVCSTCGGSGRRVSMMRQSSHQQLISGRWQTVWDAPVTKDEGACVFCNGAGKIEKITRTPCTQCGGKGWQQVTQ